MTPADWRALDKVVDRVLVELRRCGLGRPVFRIGRQPRERAAQPSVDLAPLVRRIEALEQRRGGPALDLQRFGG